MMGQNRAGKKGFFITLDVVLGLLVLFLGIALSFYYFSLPAKNTVSSFAVRSYLQDAATVMSHKGVLGAPLQSGKEEMQGVREVLRSTPDSVCMQVSVYGAQEKDNSLKGYWQLDGSSFYNFSDSSGNGNMGSFGATPNGDQPNSFTISSNCASPGSCISVLSNHYGYLVVPDSPSTHISGDFTIAVWVNIRSFQGVNPYTPRLIARKGVVSYGTCQSAFILDTRCVGTPQVAPIWNTAAGFVLCNSAGTSYTICDPTTFPRNSWQLVAGSYKSSTRNMSLYRNGVLINSTILPEGFQIYPSNAPINLGFLNDYAPCSGGSCNMYTSDQSYDNIQFYGKALSASEIASLYAAPATSLSQPLSILHYTASKDRCPYSGGEVQSLSFPFAYNTDQDETGYYTAVVKAWPKGVS